MVPAFPRLVAVAPQRAFGPLTRTDFVRYAGASGDFTPMHHDEVHAHELGLRSVFGMGLLGGGMLAEAIAEWVGHESLRSLALRFTARTWPGVALTLEGRVEDPDGVSPLTVHAALVDDDRAVVTAIATVDRGCASRL